MEIQKIMKWILPSALIVGGFLVGFIVEKIFVNKLKSAALRTKWKGDEIIISSIQGVTTLWFVLAGIY